MNDDLNILGEINNTKKEEVKKIISHVKKKLDY